MQQAPPTKRPANHCCLRRLALGKLPQGAPLEGTRQGKAGPAHSEGCRTIHAEPPPAGGGSEPETAHRVRRRGLQTSAAGEESLLHFPGPFCVQRSLRGRGGVCERSLENEPSKMMFLPRQSSQETREHLKTWQILMAVAPPCPGHALQADTTGLPGPDLPGECHGFVWLRELFRLQEPQAPP
ncbi:hypothetical protein NDU88_001920 [Pleurodeles waltl]|uniref:Uncharacterized protein n=1 Tax=Pleurodeles waltl TaxID=8319 RepID=A0AAV7P5M6_PLEWA|nr:hypothetical protein NDU88_001920 [Pleurodeles waltl]